MNLSLKRAPALGFALSTAVLCAWSSNSSACAYEPVLGAVCLMALPATSWGSFNQTYVRTDGQSLNVTTNTALYSLLGNTFGGTPGQSFNLPDLRGKVVLGSNPAGGLNPGNTGGNASIQLTVGQLPIHAVPIVALPVNLTALTATTTLTGLSGTANLAGVKISGAASGLVMNTSSGGGGTQSPAGAYLGKAPSAAGGIYASSSDSTLNSSAIGGTLSVTVGTGVTAPVVIAGTPSTVIGGTATASGLSGTVGSGHAVNILPPYLAMTYYIATKGLYPSRD